MENGKLMNLSYHRERMERTLLHFWPGALYPDLEKELHEMPLQEGLFKVRVLYDGKGICRVESMPYSVRTVRSLKLVEGGDIEYSYKSTDRARLQALLEQKGEADEIVIVKNGRLTDTSFSNIALYDGSSWYTPQYPLLKGTMRQSLLDKGLLKVADLLSDDWNCFEKVALINSMMPLGRCEVPL